MPTESVDDARLYYERHGETGEPVVCVHGSLVDHHSFDAIVGPLSQNLELLVYDRRGHGRSEGAVRAHPVRDDARDLAQLLERLDFYPVHLVAHSYGGAVALRLAHDRPEMVRSLSIHEVPFGGLLRDDPVNAADADRLSALVRSIQAKIRAGAAVEAARTITDAFSLQPGAWERLSPPVREQLARHVDRWCEEFGDPESLRPERAVLSDLLVPVLLTQGELSPPFLHRITSALAASLRNVTVHTLPESGHVPQVTQPLQYAGVLVGFLLERNVPTT